MTPGYVHFYKIKIGLVTTEKVLTFLQVSRLFYFKNYVLVTQVIHFDKCDQYLILKSALIET